MILGRFAHTFDNPFKKCLYFKNRVKTDALVLHPISIPHFCAKCKTFLNFILFYTEKSFMKPSRFCSLVLLCCLLAFALSGCAPAMVGEEINDADAVTHSDFTSVYDMIGADVTIDMVEEDERGLAFVEYGGVRYELGMDFLSIAMVYNTAVPSGSERFATSEDVYNEWWRLYIQRWNHLVPEVPLYSNEYYDLYHAKLQNFVTSPYWGVADAIVSAHIEVAENAVRIGSVTDLSGSFRNAAWGKSSAGAADRDIQRLTSGHATVMTDQSGEYIWNLSALEREPVAEKNADGTLTYTVTVRHGLKFSDGSPIRADHYLAALLANSSPVGVAAGGTGLSGKTVIGYDAFRAYDGSGATVFFEGVRKLDDYTFSVTFLPEYADYYYAMGYAAFSPDPLALYLGDAAIVTGAHGRCGLSSRFYEKREINGRYEYVMASTIRSNLAWDSPLPYSGPYTVKSYDVSSKTVTLSRNPHYTGDDARGVASIETVRYGKIVSETQLDQFQTGQLDVLAGLIGATDIRAALSLVSANPSQYRYTRYDRAGYGKLGFRADFGPTGFVEVRQAIAYTLNRPAFAQAFTGGYGSVVHGPYYTGSPAYLAGKENLKLDPYTFSPDSAVEVLESGGWIYNADGSLYDRDAGGIRYKKLEGYAKTRENLHFATTDGKYRTVRVNGEYYMPLAINYYGTQPNPVTDQLLTDWVSSPAATKQIGMYIRYTQTDFDTGLYGELQRMEESGYNGIPKLNAINFATSFDGAAYDYAFNWTIDPDEIAKGYSICFLVDEADFWENYA